MTAIEDDVSQEFSPKENSNEQDQRRLSLIHDPNYSIVLCFLDKFRSVLDLPIYSYQRLEDHLVHCQERGSLLFLFVCEFIWMGFFFSSTTSY